MDTKTGSSIWTALGDLADNDIYAIYDDNPHCIPEADGFDLEGIIIQRLDWKPSADSDRVKASVVLNQGRQKAWKRHKWRFVLLESN